MKRTFLIGGVLTAAIAVASLTTTPSAQEDGLTAAQRQEIKELVREYLLENPEIIPEAINVLRERELLALEAQAARVIAGRREFIQDDGISGELGNADGDVVVVEFFDYQCQFCRRGYRTVMDVIEGDGNIRFVAKQLPVLDAPDGPQISRFAARASLAAERQGKFAAFHDALMTAPGPLHESRILKLAAKAGLDEARLKKDMADPALDRSIANNLMLAQEIGIRGTPAYIVGGQLHRGYQTADDFKAAVTAARERAARAADAS